jgi:hypothetical protein
MQTHTDQSCLLYALCCALLVLLVLQGELQAMQLEIRTATFANVRAAEEHSAALKRLMDQSRVDTSKTHEMLAQVCPHGSLAFGAGGMIRVGRRGEGEGGGVLVVVCVLTGRVLASKTHMRCGRSWVSVLWMGV